MKKLLSGLVAIVVLLVLATNVNAAALGVSKTQVEKDDTVEVTVNMKETHSVGIWLDYPEEDFDFVSATSTIGELSIGNSNGVVKVGAADENKTTTAVKFVFKAKKLVTNANFNVTRFTNETSETLPTTSIQVSVVEKTEGGSGSGSVTPDTPAETPKNETKNEAGKGIVGADGNVVEKLPNTGAPVFGIAIALTAVAGIALLEVKKLRK